MVGPPVAWTVFSHGAFEGSARAVEKRPAYRFATLPAQRDDREAAVGVPRITATVLTLTLGMKVVITFDQLREASLL